MLAPIAPAAEVLVGSGLVVGDLDQVLVPDPAKGLRIEVAEGIGLALLHRHRQQIVGKHFPGDVPVRVDAELDQCHCENLLGGPVRLRDGDRFAPEIQRLLDAAGTGRQEPRAAGMGAGDQPHIKPFVEAGADIDLAGGDVFGSAYVGAQWGRY